jgi:dTDP-4-dehydrorhamnose reductase
MKDSKILVFGKDGQVGRALQAKLFAHPQVTFLGREDCDLTDGEQIISALKRYQPQIVINAAAYTAVDKAQIEANQAHLINAVAPRIMAEFTAKKQNACLIHFSTDYVFNGLKATPYVEVDSTDPLGEYGKSKLAGEKGIQESHLQNPFNTSKYYILRTSWVYGDGGNFIKTMLRLAAERDHLKVIADQFGVPSSAEWLAEIALKLIVNNIPSGIFHTVPDGYTTWYGLATYSIKLASECGGVFSVNPEGIEAILATEYPLPAPRPYNSRMDNSKLKDALHLTQFPNWEDQVSYYVKNLYNN